jgi:hypothetical protein
MAQAWRSGPGGKARQSSAKAADAVVENATTAARIFVVSRGMRVIPCALSNATILAPMTSDGNQSPAAARRAGDVPLQKGALLLHELVNAGDHGLRNDGLAPA